MATKQISHASSGNIANATASASLAAAANRRNYITGFHVSGAGASAGSAVAVTVTGLINGTLTYTYTAGNGAQASNNPLLISFPEPIPASADNTAITVSCPALGAGNTNNSVNVFGFTIDTVGL